MIYIIKLILNEDNYLYKLIIQNKFSDKNDKNKNYWIKHYFTPNSKRFFPIDVFSWQIANNTGELCI